MEKHTRTYKNHVRQKMKNMQFRIKKVKNGKHQKKDNKLTKHKCKKQKISTINKQENGKMLQ